MKEQGAALGKFAHPDVRVVVVANPSNTNCLAAMKCAPNIPAKNWTSLSRLDHERLRGCVARMSKFEDGSQPTPGSVRNTIIFGNHSATQVPFVGAAQLRVGDEWHSISSFPAIQAHIASEMSTIIPLVQNRGAEVIRLQGAGSAFSAALAIT